MIDITSVLLGIVALFALFISFRSLFSSQICALCGSVSATWIVLLVLFYIGNYADPVLIGILMGASAVGVMYLLEQKLPERFQVYKLPFFLTLVSAAYFALLQSFELGVAVILVLLWAFAVVLNAGQNTTQLKILGRKIIECCKNW